MRVWVLTHLVLLTLTSRYIAAEAPAAKLMTVEEVAQKAKSSVVVITIEDRNGQPLGLGTGFVISKDGLIATNLHVIGEARPIAVKFADGQRFNVIGVHATDKLMDLAVLRIDRSDLIPLELGDSDLLLPGQPVIAIGNPLGLSHSVVAGVASKKSEVEGRTMIQVAMPIEKGNSGGPLLDLNCRVHGLITLKSRVEQNLGYAVVVNDLKPLLAKPNPVPIDQWITIGSLDPKDWTQLFGTRWRQHAGRIMAEETGQGFGGRAVCLSTKPLPSVPFEVAVRVKFTPESGAAGLVFQADGEHKHYGFYPSNGKLRLTRFNGADVYSWKVIEDIPHAAYRPNDWNHLKVRVADGRIQCFINGELAIETTDDGLKSGSVGLAKFRDTKAEFKQFQLGQDLGSPQLMSPETTKRLQGLASTASASGVRSDDLIEKLASDDVGARDVLRREAKQLEQRAEQLREIAVAVHARRVQKELAEVVAKSPKSFDLLRAALLIAHLDNEDLDVDAYVREVDQLAAAIKAPLKADAAEADKFAALNDYLFAKRGFHGSRTNYYSRSNSYMNEVLDDREGLPITLSVLHMELAKRLGIKVVGVGFPGKFCVRFEPTKGDAITIDVFERGRVMTESDIANIFKENLQVEKLTDKQAAEMKAFVTAVDSPAIATRMLSNLRTVAANERDTDAIGRYADAMLVIDPDNAKARAERIDWSIRSKHFKAAIADIDWMLDRRPDGLDVEGVQKLRAQLEAELKTEK